MNPKPLAVLLALTLPLSACGNKGPLVRPSSAPLPPASTSTVPPADTSTPPADTSTPPADAGHG